MVDMAQPTSHCSILIRFLQSEASDNKAHRTITSGHGGQKWAGLGSPKQAFFRHCRGLKNRKRYTLALFAEPCAA